MHTKVYVTEQPKVGQQIIGWDNKKQDLVVTTPVTALSFDQEQGGLVASTEAGGQYLVTTYR